MGRSLAAARTFLTGARRGDLPRRSPASVAHLELEDCVDHLALRGLLEAQVERQSHQAFAHVLRAGSPTINLAIRAGALRFSPWNEPSGAGTYKGGFEASVMGDNVAVVFTGGRIATWLEKQGPEAAREQALEQVAGVFGNDIRRRLTRSIVTAWSTEPATLGAYGPEQPFAANSVG